MSESTSGLDLRLPIGGLFVALGVIIGGFGIVTRADVAMYARSGGLNVNLWWGAVLFVTGAAFLLAARRAAPLGARGPEDASSP